MINRVVLVGRLTKDPELRYTSSNQAYVKFTLAVPRSFASSNGEKETDFIQCLVWRKPAENMSKYCYKGQLISLEGRIQTGSYDDKDGNRKYTTDIVCDNVQFLERREQGEPHTEPIGETKEEWQEKNMPEEMLPF